MRKEETETSNHAATCPRVGHVFLAPAPKLGTVPSSLVAGNTVQTVCRFPSFVNHLNLLIYHPSVSLLLSLPNVMLKSAKSVVSAVGAYKQLHTMSLNGVASASHTITNLKRWSVAGKELPGI